MRNRNIIRISGGCIPSEKKDCLQAENLEVSPQNITSLEVMELKHKSCQKADLQF